MTTKTIGIVSWFPQDEPVRGQRMGRFKKLLKQIDFYFPKFPIIVIAQNWNGFTPSCNNFLYVYKYPQLGILRARKELRRRFLELGYDYLIMFDDDAIIECSDDTALTEYFDRMDNNPNGFAFLKRENATSLPSYENPYVDSQLNLCTISRDILLQEDIPEVDPQRNIAYEDRILSMLLHTKYADREFDVPEGLRCTHFRSVTRPLPSTWARDKKIKWDILDVNTKALEKYLSEYKCLPSNIWDFLQGKNAEIH